MQRVKKVFRQTSWQLLGKAITSLSTIFILGIVSRSFGEFGTGIFTLSLTYLSFFYLAADFGINAHLLSIEKLSIDFRRLFGLRLILSLSLILIAVLAILIWPTPEVEFKFSVLLGVLAILASAIFISANAIFQSKLRYDLSILASSAGAVVGLLAVYFLIVSGSKISSLMIGHLIGWTTSALVALILVSKFTSLSPIFDFKYIKKILVGVWPIAASLILNVFYFRVDSFLLAYFKGFNDVGVYNLAYQVFQSALVLPTFIMNSYYPLMIQSWSENSKKFFSEVKLASLSLMILATFGSFLTIILAPFLIKVLTAGDGFLGSTVSLQILALGFPAFFVSAILMWALVVLKKYKTMVAIYLIGLIFNFILNIIYIPGFTYLAASWVTVISEYLILALQIIILLKSAKLK